MDKGELERYVDGLRQASDVSLEVNHKLERRRRVLSAFPADELMKLIDSITEQATVEATLLFDAPVSEIFDEVEDHGYKASRIMHVPGMGDIELHRKKAGPGPTGTDYPHQYSLEVHTEMTHADPDDPNFVSAHLAIMSYYVQSPGLGYTSTDMMEALSDPVTQILRLEDTLESLIAIRVATGQTTYPDATDPLR